MADVPAISEDYTGIRAEIVALMTATYWEIGRRIAEFEQRGDVIGLGIFVPVEMLVFDQNLT